MALNLKRTLAWTKVLAAQSPEDAQWLAMLNDLQGNILKGHGRFHTANVFLNFPADKIDGAKAFLKQLAAKDVTSALQQLFDAQLHKSTGKNAGPFTAMFLTASGYKALGLVAVMPEGAAFRAGMDSRSTLNDPPRAAWDETFQKDIHAMVLLAADDDDKQSPLLRNELLDEFVKRVSLASGAVDILGVELGDQLRNGANRGIEHFGYIDGRSQPLMLEEDIQAELPNGPTPGVWDPTIRLSQVIVRDPGGELEVSCGSYFVFRKLEQNVRGFKSKELALAEANGGIEELAGASVVGRFENGFPVIQLGHHQTDMPNLPNNTVTNAFDYTGDDAGLKCPYAAHIRKTNPRRPDAQEHLMARRGITYGLRADDPNGDEINDKPEGKVGLLFMSYQSNLENQFEFTQSSWANNANFDFRAPNEVKPVGIDPIIGQPFGAAPQQFTEKWGESLGPRDDFSGFVTMKGGQYFFAPAISVLKRLAP